MRSRFSTALHLKTAPPNSHQNNNPEFCHTLNIHQISIKLSMWLWKINTLGVIAKQKIGVFSDLKKNWFFSIFICYPTNFCSILRFGKTFQHYHRSVSDILPEHSDLQTTHEEFVFRMSNLIDFKIEYSCKYMW